jgi:hypothetical protein
VAVVVVVVVVVVVGVVTLDVVVVVIVVGIGAGVWAAVWMFGYVALSARNRSHHYLPLPLQTEVAPVTFGEGARRVWRPESWAELCQARQDERLYPIPPKVQGGALSFVRAYQRSVQPYSPRATHAKS